MFPGTLIIRADATAAIGHGHVMRCLALAQAWQDRGGECVFAMAEPIPEMKARLCTEGFEVIPFTVASGSSDDAAQLAELARVRDASWIVVDGYQFRAEYHRALKSAGVRLLVIDDSGHAGSYCSDLVLDQNAGTRESFYDRRAPYTELLLGSRYAMLRREFTRCREWKREIPPIASKILVTMGGSDPENLSLSVLQSLSFSQLKGVEVTVVCGGSNPHVSALKTLAEKSAGSLRLIVGANDMSELMAWADVAVSSAGSTCWEMCMLGLPAVVIDAAPNQLPLAQELDRRKIAVHMSRPGLDISQLAAKIEWLVNAPEVRSIMSANASQLVDGRGAERVVAAMQAPMTLRPARAEDCHLLWQWTTDPSVRSASFSPEPITWEQHQAWFTSKIKDPQCLILIGEDEHGKALGQFRVDFRLDREAEIDVSVSPEHRGMGWGSRLIGQCVGRVFNSTDAQRVHAFIRVENSASIRAFQGARFAAVGTDLVKGHAAVHYLREKSQPEGKES
ncbi:MAG: UDP-2,4-diacetamido-2,4,6-trideoxy-beta-L-altropyranose hydrolase [Acidobacteria bacterium]|nr:MAG: UDP-2,4-diacetamido-2,4,6-trideoxy-beta-L-altropyranose hydrolase [Acidobacteriota bacterium]